MLGKEGFGYYNSTVYGIIYNIISNRKNPDVMYYVSNLSYKKRLTPKDLPNVSFFNIRLPKLGRITYMLYDFFSLKWALRQAKKHKFDNVSIILFSTRSGVFLPFLRRHFKRSNVSLNIYCENHEPCCDDWTITLKLLWNMSLTMCVKYANCLLFTKDSTKEYFYKTFKDVNFKMTKLDYCEKQLDKPFRAFLSKYNITPYNYYLLIANPKASSLLSSVVGKFLECNTDKKLIVLCRKDTSLYKGLVLKYDLSKDDRIGIFNIQRFIHLIPNLTKHCYGHIHTNMFDINQDPLKTSLDYDIVNIVFNSPFNKKVTSCNVLYYDEKNFIDVIYKADNLTSKANIGTTV